MASLLEWLTANEPLFRKSRLPSLYSDLAVQKTSNPDGYSANVAAWQAALKRAALSGHLPKQDRFILQTSEDLLSALSSQQYGRPSGLGSVIDDSVRSGKMVDYEEFMSVERSVYSRTWVPNPWSVVQWTLRQIGVSGAGSYESNGGLRTGKLVLVQALEEVSKEIISTQQISGDRLTDRIMTREVFVNHLKTTSGATISSQDLEIVLKYLHRDLPILSYDDRTVKFKMHSSTKPEPITSQDTTIASLKSLISTLASQTSLLSRRIINFQAAAAMSVKAGNRASALSALRSKQLASRSLDHRLSTLAQLEEVYAKIEEAADQVEIMRVMESSAGVLKALNAQIGGVETVEDVVERMRNEMGKVDEVSKVLNESLEADPVGIDLEVDEEMEKMEIEERLQNEEQEAEKTRMKLEELNLTEKVEERPSPKRTLHNEAAQTEAARQRVDHISLEDDALRIPQPLAENS